MDTATATLYRAAAKMSGSPLLEGRDLQEVYDTFVQALLGPGLPQPMRQVARWALVRIGAYELADRLCDFATFGDWALNTDYPIFLQQFPRVRSREDRLALLEQHRRWATRLEDRAASDPIGPLETRRDGKLRLGLISHGLHHHVVGQFALPLFEHPDERFELHAYSTYPGGQDDIQERMASRSVFRRLAGLSAREAALLVAEDNLDMLIELDGITGESVLNIMAYKPARLQASWLGYPHSSGLSTIDHIVLDRQLQTDLVLEKPLTLPHTWLVLPPFKFNDEARIDPTTPEERNGYVTFGTLNNPYKFTPDSLRCWAGIVAACPRSKFLFVRPETSAPSFRRGILKRFVAAGVAEDRVVFSDDRTRHHMDLYNEIDIALDPYPLGGGTTSAETLWMGVPVVSLVGEGLFERLTYSMLVNAGLADLAVESVEAYEAAALTLANAPERRKALRQGLREALKASPLGRPAQFARDFYDLMETAIHAGPVKP